MSEDKKYRICPRCEFFCNAREPDRFCSLCGGELLDACPECGHVIDNPFARYCKHCGSPMPGRNSTGEDGEKNSVSQWIL